LLRDPQVLFVVERLLLLIAKLSVNNSPYILLPKKSISDSTKMSEAQLQKCQQEQYILQEELNALKDAMNPTDASKEVIAYIQKQPDPFLSSNNEWANSDSGGCCNIM